MIKLPSIVIFIAVSGLARAEMKPIAPDQQKGVISYASEDDKGVTPERSKQWKEFCDRLSKHLLLTAKPAGFLSMATCQPLSAIPGTVKDKAAAPFWQIQVIERARFFELETSILSEKEGYQKLRTHSFKMEGDLLSNLKSKVVPLTVARMLVESLPTGWVYTHDASQEDIVISSDPDLPSLPDDLLVYDLSLDTASKKWIPKVRARLKRSKEEKGAKLRTETFKVAQSYLPLGDKKSYWVQSARGLNKREKEYTEVLAKNMQGLSLLNFLDKLLFDSFESNYAGFRYGRSFLSGTSIVTETDLFSLLVEMRSGIFSGLRYYYDMTPEKRKGSGDDLEFFSMSRGSLGWAFDYELPTFMQFLVSRIEVQPKFGLLDLKSHFSVLDETGTKQSLSFDAKNVYDLALELGAEKETLWFRSRLWYSFSAAAFGLSNKSAVSVLSNKAGLDTYFDLVNYGNWDVNILGFILTERLNLSKSNTELAADEDISISEVTFNLFFVGGGFTISW